jgi:hypothetical protein
LHSFLLLLWKAPQTFSISWNPMKYIHFKETLINCWVNYARHYMSNNSTVVLKVFFFYLVRNYLLSYIIIRWTWTLWKNINHKPQFAIKMILTLNIFCSVHEFKLLLNLLDICASYSCLVTLERMYNNVH